MDNFDVFAEGTYTLQDEDDDYIPIGGLTSNAGATSIVRGENKHGDRMDPYWQRVAKYLVTGKLPNPNNPREWIDTPFDMTPFNKHMTAQHVAKKSTCERKTERRPLAVRPIPGESRRKRDLYGNGYPKK